MPPIEALFSLLPGSCPQAAPRQAQPGEPGIWHPVRAPGSGVAGWRQEERPLRSIRIRTGVPVAAAGIRERVGARNDCVRTDKQINCRLERKNDRRKDKFILDGGPNGHQEDSALW